MRQPVLKGLILAGLLVAGPFGPGYADDWDEDEGGGGRSFLYWEVVLSGVYAPSGIRGLPPDDPTEDHVELSPRPPGSYVALDWVRTFDSSGRWAPTALDLHPRLLYDPMEVEDGIDQIKFAPQDFWVRLEPGRHDRFALYLGQFVIPYGVNPILAPRQRFILPVEAVDLGLKWDWGIDLAGPLASYDWEVAATIGSGEALHSPHIFDSSSPTSFLITGRLGAPTYWDFQYGLSFLGGDLPVIRGPNRLSEESTSRWRVGLDSFYRRGLYLMMGAQLTYGRNGFAEDGIDPTDTLGYQLWVDWVVPRLLDLRLAAQWQSIIRDVDRSDSDDTALVLEAGYSLRTAVSLMLDFRHEVHLTMGDATDGIFLSFIYYAL